MPQALRILFFGEGLALSAVIEHARRRGHLVVGVFATAAAEARVLRRSGFPVCRGTDSPAQFAAAHAHDVLLSVNNGRVLDEATLRRASVAAVNYHNGPLPAYAGLRATTWAILNGEARHGITWHRLEPGIDTGDILVQRCFDLSPHETTASLNRRCTEAAIESLGALFAALEGGAPRGQPQDLAARSYFRRADTVAQAGLLDWRSRGEDLTRLIRACDWGGLANDFGLASVALPGRQFRHALQATFEPRPAASRAAPGHVLDSTGESLRVACADGEITLTLDRAADLAAGTTLPRLELEDLADLGVAHGAALHAERAWLPVLELFAARPSRTAMPEIVCADALEQDRLLAAIGRALGGGALVAVQVAAPTALSSGWLPLRAREALRLERPPPLLDVALRHASLRDAAAWWDHADFRLRRAGLEGAPAPLDDAVALARIAAVREALDELAREAAAPVSAPFAGLLPALFARAAEDPRAPAIGEGPRDCSREELLRRAGELARALRFLGLERRAGVGILLGPGADFVVAALAAMLARGAYVPLNLQSPDARRVVEIAEGGITHLITHRATADALPALDVEVLCLDEPLPGRRDAPLEPVAAHDAAYRIFTSGSTGRPKAVEVTHAALQNLIAHYGERLALSRSDRTSFLAHPTFDASVADLWPLLAAGGTVLIPPPHSLLDPPGLIEWLHQQRITHAFVPTAIGARLLRLPWPKDVALRCLLTGGEALHLRPPAGLPFELINTYGPTENTVDSLWAVVGPGDGPPPIGLPIGGVTARVVDETGESVAPGEPGELILGGRQLARGYFGRPDLTAERFETQRFGPGRWYRTGDRVRVNAAGEYEFLGRLDHQLQLRGIRVEPGEIEAVLLTDARVRAAVCVPGFEGPDVTSLTAHVATACAEASLAESLLTLLRAHLVPALVPRAILIHAELPRTAAGKIDRAALAAQSPVAVSVPEADPLVACWRQAVPDAGASADEARSFWDLGGTSIAAMELLLAVHARLGVRVPIARFLAEPTLDGLRGLVRQHPSSMVIEFRRGTGVPLVFWYGLSGDLEQFQHVVREDLGDRSVLGVMSPVTQQSGQLPGTLEEAVHAGLTALRAHGVAGTPCMVGISFGGLLAFEAARQLAAAGTPDARACLIGTHPPQLARGRLARLLHFLGWLPVSAYRKLRRGAAAFSAGAVFRRLARLLGERGHVPPDPAWPAAVYYQHAELAHRYRPQAVVPLGLHLVRDLDSRERIDLYGYVRYDKQDLGWGRWSGAPVTTSWMPGDHDAAATRANAAEFAALLRAASAPPGAAHRVRGAAGP